MNGIAKVILLIMFILNISINPINEVVVEPVVKVQVAPVYIQHISPIDNIKYVTEDIIVEEPLMAQEDIDLIALVTMAEAEGECEEGKRLVIDTILNRVDSTYFPDTVHGVIYQKNAFSSMWNGRVDRCSVKEEIVILVEEELRNRLNYDVVFFTAGQYGKYGKPLFQVGNHYFASYE
jgi:N-acetylmuramoyl-L-alanine amidase